MKPWESVKIALRALHTNKLRSSLTMLGMIIGVGAVIAMVAIGQGAAAKIQEQFDAMGTNMLLVHSGGPRMRPGPGGPPAPGTTTSLVIEDARLIATRFTDTVAMVAPVTRGSADLKLGNKLWNTSIVGTTPEYETVAKFTVAEGRFISPADEEGRERVAVVGRTVIESLTGDRHADFIGQEVLLNRVAFKVVGILTEKGAGGFGQDQDDVAVIPCSTALRRVFNRTYLSEICITCNSRDDMDLATEEIANLMRDRHKLRAPFPDNDDFSVRSQAQLMEASAQSSSTMTSLLGGIALVSLFVGGIGIMNIMLVSVTERTREIGIRKSVGATRANILLQFLIEAVVISTLGGAMGIVTGLAISKLLGLMLHWDVLIQPSAVVLAVAVSASIGIFFGIYPAQRAAQLHPIDALRFE